MEYFRNKKKSDFDYTIVLDGNYAAEAGHPAMHEKVVDTEETADASAAAAPVTEKKADSREEKMDRLYYDYEKMCMKDPTVLDKDDIYPHSYQWRMGDRYDAAKETVLREALETGRRIEATDAYQSYLEEIRHRRFTPDSWD